MSKEQIDSLSLIFNYSDEELKSPLKSTMVTKMIFSEGEDYFEIEEGDEVSINGFDVLIQSIGWKDDIVRIVIGVAHTIRSEDDYNEIIEWFIENEWNVEDSLYLYEEL